MISSSLAYIHDYGRLFSSARLSSYEQNTQVAKMKQRNTSRALVFLAKGLCNKNQTYILSGNLDSSLINISKIEQLAQPVATLFE